MTRYKNTSVAGIRVVVYTDWYEGECFAKVVVGYNEHYEGEEIGFSKSPNEGQMESTAKEEKLASDAALKNAYACIMRGDLYNR